MSTKQTPAEAEEVKDLEQVEEVQDLVEAPEEIKEVKEAVEEVKAPVLRGGLRGAADPNMIQKHIDNFLAMLCGETPVDSNVRTSAEYWLKRLATGEGAGSTKKIYIHPVILVHQDSSGWESLSLFIFDDNPEAYDTYAKLKTKLFSVAAGIGATARFPFSGIITNAGGTFIPSHADVTTTEAINVYGGIVGGARTYVTITNIDFTVYDGVNAIN